MRVAMAFGQDPHAVAGRPFAQTAWAFLTLLEVEEFDELKRDAAGLQAAARMALAFNEPKKLEDERLSLLARLRGTASETVEAARERGQRLVERLRAGRVLDDGMTRTPEGPDGH